MLLCTLGDQNSILPDIRSQGPRVRASSQLPVNKLMMLGLSHISCTILFFVQMSEICLQRGINHTARSDISRAFSEQ